MKILMCEDNGTILEDIWLDETFTANQIEHDPHSYVNAGATNAIRLARLIRNRLELDVGLEIEDRE